MHILNQQKRYKNQMRFIKGIQEDIKQNHDLDLDYPKLRLGRSLTAPPIQSDCNNKISLKSKTIAPVQFLRYHQKTKANLLNPTQLSSKYQLKSGGYMLPSYTLRRKDPNLSQDSMIIFPNVCGVADGVGQWKKFKINPRIFGEKLLTKTCSFIQEKINYFNDIFQLGKQSMHQAFQNSEELESIDMVQRTNSQQFRFNAPVQLIKWPSQEYLNTLDTNRANQIQQMQQQNRRNPITPNQAIQCKIPIQEKDIIIAGSDGIFDNISDDNIISILQQTLNKYSIQEIATFITETAWDLSKMKNYESPFAQEAKRNNLQYKGGKPDDCTTLISQITGYE